MTVLSLAGVRVEPDDDVLVSAGISQPASSGPLGGPTFVVRGWALGEDARALAVEIRAGDNLVRVAPVREPTPEIAAAHPDRPGAAHCGFLTRVHVGALGTSSALRLDAVLASGGRAAIGTIALRREPAPPRTARGSREPPSIRPEVEQLVLREADRLDVAQEGLLAPPGDPLGDPRIAALDGLELEGRTVLDLFGGAGHVARAARARGAAQVDSVHVEDELADLARLLDLYHRMTRVFVHDSLEAVDGDHDVVVRP